MSHCWLYGDKYEDCKDYPVYCDNRCCMYRLMSAKETGEALKQLAERLEKLEREKGR